MQRNQASKIRDLLDRLCWPVPELPSMGPSGTQDQSAASNSALALADRGKPHPNTLYEDLPQTHTKDVDTCVILADSLTKQCNRLASQLTDCKNLTVSAQQCVTKIYEYVEEVEDHKRVLEKARKLKKELILYMKGF